MISIEYAIQSEAECERYYKEQAALLPGSPLQAIFSHLADAERKHGHLLRKVARLEGFTAPESPSDNLFGKLADFHHEFIDKPVQLEVYRRALSMENKSLELYASMLANATESQERDLLKYLLKQERAHKALFEQLELLLTRPAEWVEAAEFGKREEY